MHELPHALPLSQTLQQVERGAQVAADIGFCGSSWRISSTSGSPDGAAASAAGVSGVASTSHQGEVCDRRTDALPRRRRLPAMKGFHILRMSVLRPRSAKPQGDAQSHVLERSRQENSAPALLCLHAELPPPRSFALVELAIRMTGESWRRRLGPEAHSGSGPPRAGDTAQRPHSIFAPRSASSSRSRLLWHRVSSAQ
jgi:hypothetical protein